MKHRLVLLALGSSLTVLVGGCSVHAGPLEHQAAAAAAQGRVVYHGYYHPRVGYYSGYYHPSWRYVYGRHVVYGQRVCHWEFGQYYCYHRYPYYRPIFWPRWYYHY